MPEENWDNQLEYLQKSRFMAHNDDYLEFLVTKVWQIEKPVKIVDFGCGFGYMGTKLMPLLPSGSSYTGVDKAPALLNAARKLFSSSAPYYLHEFVTSEVYKTPFKDDTFDIAIAHSVLMHIERPMEALREMIRVTRHGGMVITTNANRNAWNALFYVDELNTQETTPLTFSQQMNKDIRRKTGVDYNIGIKVPVMMDRAGLKDIGCRMDDRVTMLLPSMDSEEKKKVFEALCISGLALPENFKEKQTEMREKFLSYGISPEDIERQFENEEQMDFRHNGLSYHTMYPELATWAYGTVVK
jgi:ubiquinone/menaquinone biosynthesis C-methylase UbiE